MSHVTIVSTSYPDGHGGSEAAGAFVADFAKELSNITEVSIVAPGRAGTFSNEEGIEVFRFRTRSTPLSLLRPLHPMDWPQLFSVMSAGHHAVLKAVRRTHAAHILALWSLPSGLWARHAANKYRIPYSTWSLGSDIWSLGRIPLFKRLLASVLAGSDCCFADGIALARDVERLSGRECDYLPSCRTLPPRDKSPRSTPPYRLAFLGRWHHNKGVDILLDALFLLSENDWQSIEEIRIAGGGPLDSRVREDCGRLESTGLPVSMRGFADRDAAADILSWADYLLIPSRIESIPVILSDAVQIGTPIISTPVGDIPDVLARHGIGLLSDDTSAASLARAIRTALQTPPTSFHRNLAKAQPCFSITAAARQFANRIHL